MRERKTSWIDHPAFLTINRGITKSLRSLAYDYSIAVRSGDLSKAIELIEQAKQIKRDNFPFEVIRGGKI